MNVDNFLKILGSEFYAGVPDSQLKPLCNNLYASYGVGKHHVVCANEGNAVAMAAGYYLSTGKISVVYLQNSGLGNIINPVASLLHPDVYGIPCIFVIGWRGEPGVKDEPQHIFQGKTTLQLLADMEIEAKVVDAATTEEELQVAMEAFTPNLLVGKSVAFLIKKGGLQGEAAHLPNNSYNLCREEAIKIISSYVKNDFIVATTGKISRELWEIRNIAGQTHAQDFLTVGSMGHASSISAAIALQAPDKKIWCLDGDGAALMHMGAMAVIGSLKLDNMVHVVLNNACHESVGEIPTVAGDISLPGIATACGYQRVYSVENKRDLEEALTTVSSTFGSVFLEVKVSQESRGNLGRPTVSPQKSKEIFMEKLRRN